MKRWSYDVEAGDVENRMARVEALREIAVQLERIADVLEDDDA